MVINSTSPSLPEDQLASIRLLISILSVSSTILCGFVVLTCAIFEGKRKSSVSVSIFLQSLVTFFLELAFIIPGFYGEEISDGNHVALCNFQAFCFLYFGLGIVYAWFFVAFNLFLRINLDMPELNPIIPVACSLLLPIISSIVPFITGDIIYEGAWCFIDSAQPAVLYGAFYGIMFVLAVSITPLWIGILTKMFKSILEERKKERVRQVNEQTGIASAEGMMQQVRYEEKVVLLVRQLVYVTGSMIISYVQLLMKISMTFLGPSYNAIMVHAAMIGIIGIFVFFVFGFTKNNLMLWLSLLDSKKKKDLSIKNIQYQSI